MPHDKGDMLGVRCYNPQERTEGDIYQFVKDMTERIKRKHPREFFR